jgi:hypothetical protein
MTGSVRTRDSSGRFSRKTTRAVSALLQCRSIARAAQSIDVSERTLRRWKEKPEFAAALAAAQAEIFFATCNELRLLGTDATKALGQVLRNQKAPTPSRVRAAGLILSLLLRSHQTEVLEARMNAIQSSIDALQKSKGVIHA